jgi:hypothetical protein
VNPSSRPKKNIKKQCFEQLLNNTKAFVLTSCEFFQAIPCQSQREWLTIFKQIIQLHKTVRLIIMRPTKWLTPIQPCCPCILISCKSPFYLQIFYLVLLPFKYASRDANRTYLKPVWSPVFTLFYVTSFLPYHSLCELCVLEQKKHDIDIKHERWTTLKTSFYTGVKLGTNIAAIQKAKEYEKGKSAELSEKCAKCFYHGRRNFKDTNPLMSFSLVILFGVVK